MTPIRNSLYGIVRKEQTTPEREQLPAAAGHQPVTNAPIELEDDWLWLEDNIENQNCYRRVWAGYTPTVKDRSPNWDRRLYVLAFVAFFGLLFTVTLIGTELIGIAMRSFQVGETLYDW